MEKSEMKFKVVKNNYPTSSVYVFDGESKCLRQITIKCAKYNIKLGTSELTWTEAETNREIVSDLSDLKIYASGDGFNAGQELKACCVISEVGINDLLKDFRFKGYRYLDNGRVYVWTYINGSAQKWYLDEHISELTFDHTDKYNRQDKADVGIPETYRSAEDVYCYNDYTVVNSDGTKEFHEGVYKRLILSEEQNALVDKLQKVINECKDAHIKLAFDTCDYQLYAFNMANIDRLEYDAQTNDDEEAYSFDLRKARSIENVYDVNQDDSSYCFVIKK